MTSGNSGPQAGWYDDPGRPGIKRYWDGQSWTDATWDPSAPAPTSPPNPAPPNPPPTPTPPNPTPTPAPTRAPAQVQAAGVPFQAGPHRPGVASPGTSSGPATGLLAVGGVSFGDWLNHSFSVLFANWKPVLGLSLFPLPVVLITTVIAHQLVGRLQWSRSGGIAGLNTPLLVVTAIAVVITGLVTAVSILAVSRYLHDAYRGAATSVNKSLSVGLARLPRYIGLQILALMVSALALSVPVGTVVVAFVAVDDNPIVPTLIGVLLTIVGFVLSVLFIVWFWVKFAGYTSVAAVAVPRGTSAIASSWRLSTGSFWSVFFRLVSAAFLASILGSVAQILTQFAAPLLATSRLETTPTGVYVDGRNINSLDVFMIGDFLPSLLLLLPFVAVTVVAGIIPAVAKTAAVVGTWHDAGGPAEPLAANQPVIETV